MRPLDVDGVRTVAIGTVLWAVAFVVLALRRDRLDEQGQGWWLWACLAGVGLGLLGLEYTRKRRDAIAQAKLEAEADLPDEPEILEEREILEEPESLEEPQPVDRTDALEEPSTHAEPELLDTGPPVPSPTGRRARRR